MVSVKLSAGLSMPAFCISLSYIVRIRGMSSGVASGMYMWIKKTLVVAESVEYTPVRYMLSMSSCEGFCESGASASGIWRSRRRDGWCMYL